ncbi:ABC transporter permease [Paraglaciecola sp. 20A4]|uniref:ABC transporter permease n=1 Tax=Paraglaciecola sp. 20A4 TaxID=2687288 RepID=UPI00140864D4|nr:ABC transporter permease [Paraglaciecola sp. 20A4]
MRLLFWYLRTVVQSYPSAWFRLAMLYMALMIGCIGVSAVLVINQGAEQSYVEQGQGLLPLVEYKLVAVSGAQLSKLDYAQVRRLGVTEAVAVTQISTLLFDAQHHQLTDHPLDIIGFDSLALLNYQTTQQQATPLQGQSQQAKLALKLTNLPHNSAFLSTELYTKLAEQVPGHLATDDSIVITTAQSQRLPLLQHVNLANMDNEIMMDISLFAQQFGDTPISDILIVGEISPHRLNDIRRLLPAHLTLLSVPSIEKNTGMSDSFQLNLLAMALLMFVVCLFIVMNACQLLIMQRLPMLKIFRQLGISRLSIITGQLLELWLLTLLGAALGVYLGVALALYLAPSIQVTLESLFRVSVGFAQVSYLSLFVQVLLLSIVGVTLAALMPVKQLNQTLYRTDANSPTKSFWFTLGAWLLFFLAVITLWLSQSILVSLIGIALLILAGCFVLITCYPYVLNTTSALVPKKWPLLHWSLQHSLWLSGRSKIACCAFFIALMSNIGMNLMVDSFRQATHDWLNQRLIADYYLYQTDKIDAATSIQQLGLNIQAVQRFELKAQYAGLPIQVHSHPSTASFVAALKTQSQLPNAGAIYATGQGAYVNQQFALRNGINLGQSLSVPLNSGVSVFTVVGIVYDYGNPYGQILLPPALFNDKSKRSNVLALYGDSAQINTLSNDLEKQGFNRAQQLYSANQLLNLSMATFERTFLITDSLNIVTLLVAAISLACGIIVLMQDTKPQLTLLRTLGVSRWVIQGLSLLQYLFLCLWALVFAIPFGIFLSWLLINLINKQAFYWTYPLNISIGQIASVSAMGLLLVSMIILLPLLWANNKPLIRDIRWLN